MSKFSREQFVESLVNSFQRTQELKKATETVRSFSDVEAFADYLDDLDLSDTADAQTFRDLFTAATRLEEEGSEYYMYIDKLWDAMSKFERDSGAIFEKDIEPGVEIYDKLRIKLVEYESHIQTNGLTNKNIAAMLSLAAKVRVNIEMLSKKDPQSLIPP